MILSFIVSRCLIESIRPINGIESDSRLQSSNLAWLTHHLSTPPQQRWLARLAVYNPFRAPVIGLRSERVIGVSEHPRQDSTLWLLFSIPYECQNCRANIHIDSRRYRRLDPPPGYSIPDTGHLISYHIRNHDNDSLSPKQHLPLTDIRESTRLRSRRKEPGLRDDHDSRSCSLLYLRSSIAIDSTTSGVACPFERIEADCTRCQWE